VNGNDSMHILSNGNMGIGTYGPTVRLHVVSATPGDYVQKIANTDTSTNGGFCLFIYTNDTSVNLCNARARVALRANNNYVITNSGSVGIGTMTPTAGYKLDVNGAIRATSVIGAVYQDVAEWVPSEEDLAAGTVVVLRAGRTNEVTPSQEPYDTKVAGVVSAQPGILLGQAGDGKAKIATTGRVRVRVDATQHSIDVGDL